MNAKPPYHVDRLDTEPAAYRLAGPGITSKTWNGEDQRERLEEMAELMNFVWEQCELAKARGRLAGEASKTNIRSDGKRA